MDLSNSIYSAFDKRRVRFSDWIVQYVLFCDLFFCGLLVGTYFVVNEKISESVAKTNQLQDIAYQGLDLSHKWHFIEDHKESYAVADLLQTERLLAQQLREVLEDSVVLPSAPLSIAQFTLKEQIQLADNRIEQIQQIARERSVTLKHPTLLQDPLVVALLVGWLLFVGSLLFGWRRMLLDRKQALSFFHNQLDKVQSGHLMQPPIQRMDEFADFARYLDSVLGALTGDLTHERETAAKFQTALSLSHSLKMLLNEQREVLNVSHGLAQLWTAESYALSETLGVDGHLDSLEGEVATEAILSESRIVTSRIAGRQYEVKCTEIEGATSPYYLVELVPQEAHLELRVLEATLSLMANDVWDAPIRLLDDSSPFFSFSQKLEQSRKQVEAHLARFNQIIKNCDKDYPKVTKLQQLPDWVVAKLASNEASSDEFFNYQSKLVSEVSVSQQEFLQVREQVEYRFELYEAYLQQLVEWQASQSTWVANVNEGLTDTKEAILNLLSLMQSDPTSASVIEHSVIDLVHDVDTVLSDILDTKPVPGEFKLEHVKSSESDLMRHLNVVQDRLERLTDVAKQSQAISKQ